MTGVLCEFVQRMRRAHMKEHCMLLGVLGYAWVYICGSLLERNCMGIHVFVGPFYRQTAWVCVYTFVGPFIEKLHGCVYICRSLL